VFYDAPTGQARVLGGGFIQSATARSASEKAVVKGAAEGIAAPRPLAEAIRG
jgi:tRNA-specific 2-thiouridylase